MQPACVEILRYVKYVTTEKVSDALESLLRIFFSLDVSVVHESEWAAQLFESLRAPIQSV